MKIVCVKSNDEPCKYGKNGLCLEHFINENVAKQVHTPEYYCIYARSSEVVKLRIQVFGSSKDFENMSAENLKTTLSSFLFGTLQCSYVHVKNKKLLELERI